MVCLWFLETILSMTDYETFLAIIKMIENGYGKVERTINLFGDGRFFDIKAYRVMDTIRIDIKKVPE